jgi:hypothetical protein
MPEIRKIQISLEQSAAENFRSTFQLRQIHSIRIDLRSMRRRGCYGRMPAALPACCWLLAWLI